jgi:murein DD-endopeptidase MepM/ murein hydrolase activator NlpD
LEDRLGSSALKHRNELTVKTAEIRSLEQEIRDLDGQNELFRSRMDEISELESKLRQFIGNHADGASDESRNVAEVAATAYSAAMGTASVAVSDASSSDIVSIAAMESNIEDFSELSRMLDDMAISMAEGLRKAELKRAEIESLPSEWPTVSRRLTSGFGYRSDPFTGRSAFHAGVDITGEMGDPVYAAGDGQVKEAGFNRTRGNYIIITHRDGLESWYMHLKVFEVKPNQRISRGDLIAEMGNSGRSTGPHLHFQVVANEEPVNPLPYLRKVKED